MASIALVFLVVAVFIEVSQGQSACTDGTVLFHLTEKVHRQETKINDLAAKLEGKAERPPIVGFHVATSKDHGATTVIPFDTIVHNYGTHWDKATSTFKAPVKGLYWLQLVSMNQGNNLVRTAIVIDGKVVQRTHIPNDQHGNTAPASTVVMLNKGDRVNARVESGKIHGNVGFGNFWTYFTGFLLQKA